MHRIISSTRELSEHIAATTQRGAVVSFVGAGGKSSTIFSLAKNFAEGGKRVAITTTTKIFDPRHEADKQGKFSEVILEPFEEVAAYVTSLGPVVFAQRVEGPKLKGIPPARVKDLAPNFDLVLVEADGAKQRLVKAPAAWEPVIPQQSDLVVGVIGSKSLGRPMDDRTVFRPEIFEAITSCGSGEEITRKHLDKLIRHPQGLFKGTPDGAGRIVLMTGD